MVNLMLHLGILWRSMGARYVVPSQRLARGVIVVATASGIALPFIANAQTAAGPAKQPDRASARHIACAERHSISLDTDSPWQCELSLTPQQAYVVRAEQRDIDMVIAVVDSAGRAVLSTNSPTKRAGPELVLVGPQLTGRYVIELRPAVAAITGARVEVVVSPLEATANSALIRGLGDMTRAAVRQLEQASADAEKVITQLRSAQQSLRAANSPEYEAEALLRIASVYYWQINDWSVAAAAASDAMTAYARLSQPLMESQAALIRAASLLEIAYAVKQPGRRSGSSPGQTQFDEAMSLLSSAAQRFQEATMPYDQAQATNYLGIAFFYQGQYGAARSHFQQAARLFHALGERSSEALPRQNTAMIDYDGGDYAKAIDSYQSLLPLLSPVNDPGYYMSVLLNLGSAQYVLGDFERALQSFITALQLSEEKAFVAEQARSLHGLGLVYLAIGERERASVFLERALALRRPIAKQDPRGLQTSLLWVGDLKRESGDIRAALDLHVEALDSALTVTDQVRTLYSIGRDHEARDDSAAAMQAYESALKLDLPEDWPIRVSVLGAYGRAMLHAGDAAGRDFAMKAARLHESRGDNDLAAQNYLTLALDDRSHARLKAAVGNAEKATALFESQRLRTVNPDLRATYLGNRAAAYELQGDLYTTLWQQAADPMDKSRLQGRALATLESNRRQALNDFRELAHPVVAAADASAASDDVALLDAQIAAKRHRLAVIMEQATPAPDKIESLREDISVLRTRLDLAQARSGTSTGSSPKATSPAASTQALQSTLERNTALLVYQLGDDRSWLWAVTRESASAYELPRREEIERFARTLYATWSSPGVEKANTATEIAASRAILGAASRQLRGRDTVVVVADGILNSLPFGALWVDSPGAATKRLTETHSVIFRSTMQPGAGGTLWPASGAISGNRILLIGDPTVSKPVQQARPEFQADPWSWQPLPGTRREVQTIAAIAADWRSYVLLGAEATKPALLSMPLDTFRAIHFATHARLDVQDPQLSSIALSSRDTSFASSNSTLNVREILGFKLHAETVVLSACEASLGKNYRGQLSFGLSQAFLLAGARNVLGSLWRVSDEAAQEYMRRFYEDYIRNDASPAAAARAAARAMSREPRFRHPYFWAAFVVTQR